ncbi:MAG: hypothetical protein H6873_11960 [Hyphomicrobiaceae bacterium]|nr:hypothetical protein [Hyphomicrobiaceae bacterium]
MRRLKILLWIIAISQLVLGALTLVAPATFFGWMGLTPPPADNNYMLGMLAARFFAYGIGMIWLTRQQEPALFWIRNMVFIQAIDFAVGAFYLATGAIGPATAAFPMFNAAIFGSLLWLWSRPRQRVATAG